jgi:hypothetical protein
VGNLRNYRLAVRCAPSKKGLAVNEARDVRCDIPIVCGKIPRRHTFVMDRTILRGAEIDKA